MSRITLAAACVAGLVALSGCAAGPGTPGDGGSESTPGVTMTPSSTPSPSEPAPTGRTPTFSPPELTQPATSLPPGSDVTVVGTVVVSSVEMGCLMLEGYELYGGDPAVVRPGQRVRVSGRIATDMVSTCQQGPILVVTSAQPA